MNRNAIVSAIISGVMVAAGSYGFGVQPAQSERAAAIVERDEYAANGQMIRDMLVKCQADLEKCWRECPR
jgi:hypothetical protein